MFNIWTCYRGFIGSTMVLLMILGCSFITFGLTETYHEVLDQWPRDWKDNQARNEDIQPVRRTNTSALGLASDAYDNRTLTLKWPAIPIELDKFGDQPYAWTKGFTSLLITLGVLAILLALLGMYTVYNYTFVCIITFTAFMIAFIMVQFFSAFIHTTLDSMYVGNVRSSLRDILQSKYEIGAEVNNHFTVALNSVMLSWNCCGVAGPADFLSTEYNYTWAYTHDDREVFHQPVVFPLACCKREIRKKGFEATLHCAASGDSRQIYNKGCYPVVVEYIFREHGVVAMEVFKYIIAFQVLQIIMVTTLTSIPKDFETEATKLSIEYAQNIELQARDSLVQANAENRVLVDALEELDSKTTKGKDESGVSDTGPARPGLTRRHVFVPFANISSTTRNDRLGSTEIW